MAVPYWTDINGPDLDPDVAIRAAVVLYPWFAVVKSGFIGKASMDSAYAVKLVSRFSEMFQLRHWYRQWDGDFEDRLSESLEEFKALPPPTVERVLLASTPGEAMVLAGWVDDLAVTPTVVVRDTQCFVRTERYRSGGRVALELVCMDGEVYTTATVNIPGCPLDPDEVLVKDYSENEGVLAALLNGGVVLPPSEKVPTGFCEVYRCRLNPDKFPALVPS